MGDAALGSDHVNYLILRYLQESGFEDAARSLHREWNRDDQFRDPEALPFAPVVKQQELVHIIQDGLYHDKLQAEIVSTPRRFRLTSLAATSAPAASRAGAKASLRQGIFTSRDAAEDFPFPPPKRVRHSNASETITNGDAMDIDEKTENDDRMTTTSDQDQAPVEEPVAIETKAVATQTERAHEKLKTDAVYWTLDKSLPIVILHTLWNPNSENSAFLLTAGESMCRLYNLALPHDSPMAANDALEVKEDHVVTAAAWHPTGQYFTCAVKGPTQMDEIMPGKSLLADCYISGETKDYDPWFDMITVALRYSKSGNTLVIASTDGALSVLEVRDLTDELHRKYVTAYEYVRGSVVLDVACISDTSFAVCGKGLVSIWSLSAASADSEASDRHLSIDHNADVPADLDYDKIRYDAHTGLLVAVATTTGDTFVLHNADGTWSPGPSITLPKIQAPNITAVVFQPRPESDTASPSTLAIAFRTGEIAVYHLTSKSCTLHATLRMDQREEALALSWAPGGIARLAAASDEAIKVWDLASDEAQEVLAWRAAPAEWYIGDEHHLPDDEDARMEPTLGWDAEGSKLAFAVGRKVAIVSIVQEAKENGAK